MSAYHQIVKGKNCVFKNLHTHINREWGYRTSMCSKTLMVGLLCKRMSLFLERRISKIISSCRQKEWYKCKVEE